jgi:hypothetical protein
MNRLGGSGGRRWGVTALVGFSAACSSSGVVLETRRGDPSPRADAGAVSASEDAGPLRGVDHDSLRSGSRIDVRVVVSDGALLRVTGMHDTFHDVDCSIQTADDGTPRCLPSSAARVVFADSNCTQPVFEVEPGGPPCWGPPAPPPYAFWQSPSHCPQNGAHLVVPGKEIQQPPQLYDTANVSGTCQPTTATSLTSFTGGTPSFYAANPSPPSDWVTFEKTIKPLTSQLGVIQWMGSDGSRFVGDTVLLSNGAPCGPGGTHGVTEPGTVYRCMPSNVQGLVFGPYFSDAACTVAVSVAPACAPPDLLVEFKPSNDSCIGNEDVSYFSLGEVVANANLFAPLDVTSGPAPCTSASSRLDGVVVYTKGAPVDPSTYPAMQMVLTGSGRVRHYEWQSEGVSITDAGNWTDAATGAAVQAAPFPAGVSRGVFSTSLGLNGFYADAQCKMPILGEPTSPDTCGTPSEMPRWVAIEVPPKTCDGTTSYESSVRRVGARYTGTIYSVNLSVNVENNGGCSEYVPAKSSVTYDFYELGNPVPASSLFAEIKTVDL